MVITVPNTCRDHRGGGLGGGERVGALSQHRERLCDTPVPWDKPAYLPTTTASCLAHILNTCMMLLLNTTLSLLAPQSSRLLGTGAQFTLVSASTYPVLETVSYTGFHSVLPVCCFFFNFFYFCVLCSCFVLNREREKLLRFCLFSFYLPRFAFIRRA